MCDDNGNELQGSDQKGLKTGHRCAFCGRDYYCFPMNDWACDGYRVDRGSWSCQCPCPKQPPYRTPAKRKSIFGRLIGWMRCKSA